MKFKITFKDPNAGPLGRDVPESHQDVWLKYVEYDEYVTIEFDPKTQRARVVPVRR